MDEKPEFHMTIVTRKRRRSPSEASADPEQAKTEAFRSGSEHHHSSGEHHHSSGEHHHSSGEHHHSSGERHHDGSHHSSSHRSSRPHRSHRHYQDYGTLDLGDLPDTPRERSYPSASIAAAPTPEAQMTDRFAPLLNRKYRKHKNTRLIFGILAAVILLLIAVTAVLLGKKYFSEQDTTIETQEPLESIDLNDLIYD